MIAIHHREGSFSNKWVEYCQNNNVEYKLVNCYSSTIVNDLNDCNILMWHWHHSDYKASLFARELTASLEKAGKKVFPDLNTCWHFDDKLGQKYLFEALSIPLIKSHIFYDKYEAIKWVSATVFPKVFKLRCGAGAENVALLKNKKIALKKINKAFGKGFGKKNRLNFLAEKLWHFKRDKTLKSFFNISKGIGRVFIPTRIEKNFKKEKGYFYCQDFIPNNNYDIRVIVIGNRAFAIKRMVRKDDFRASGSGNIIYNPQEIPRQCIELSFESTNKLQAQCVAYDFVFLDKEPLIVEISYAFTMRVYLDCPGYWDNNLNWIEGNFTPEFFMIEDILSCE